jgi:hypothetical protein
VPHKWPEFDLRPDSRPTISVEKLALLCNPASGGTLQALQLHCVVGYKFAVVKAKVFPRLAGSA